MSKTVKILNWTFSVFCILGFFVYFPSIAAFLFLLAADPATFTHWLRRFYDRNGFSREFHVHTLRHYAITTMLAEGISKQTVAGIAGHASTDFLERTYCHPQMESRMLAAERLSNVLFPS